MAGFRRWIPSVNFDGDSSVPLAFVLQLADKLTPSHITDSFSQAVIFDHVLDSQTLHVDHLVFVDDACRKLVLVVTRNASCIPTAKAGGLRGGGDNIFSLP
jgi:hypothetical protein